MAQSHIIHLLILVACFQQIVYAEDTAYDILVKNNLPRGLLPQGVKSYVLSPEGKLEVTLPSECSFFITLGGQQFKMKFASTFGGIVQSGSIKEVYGVDVQIKFAWLGFNEVDRDGDKLALHVQNYIQSFPVSNFAVSPTCN